MDRTIKSQAISGLKWSAISKIITSLVSLIQVSVLARYLSKEDFGLIGIAILVNGFCGIFTDMGMATSTMYEENLTKQKLSSYFWLNISLGALLFIIASMSAPLIAAYYDREELVGVISFTSLLIFIHSLYSLHRTVQQKQMNFRFMTLVDVSASLLALVLTITFAINGFGVYSFVWAQIMSTIVIAVAYLGRVLIIEHNLLFYFNIIEIKYAFHIGIFQVGSNVIDFFSREMDSLIVSSCLPMEFFGVYTLCKTLAMRIYVIVNPIITNVLTPVFVKMQADIQMLSDTYKKTVEIIGYINFILYAILAVCASSILIILYGSSYKEYSYVLFFFSIYYAFLSLGNPVGSLIVATGRTDRGFYWTVLKVVVTFFYLQLASKFDMVIFMALIAIFPIILAYPSWRILIRRISTLGFKEFLALSIKPFIAICPLLLLYFLDGVLGNPIISIFGLAAISIAGYYAINLVSRPQLQRYIIKTFRGSLVSVR